jgi:tetratricopeptide (TPR) repeat protein
MTNIKEMQINKKPDYKVDFEELKNYEMKEPSLTSEYFKGKGLVLARKMFFKEAILEFSKAIAMDPFNGLLYRHRGHRYISTRRFEEAAADFELSVRLDPTNWDSWYHLGLAYYLLRDYSKAKAAYLQCLSMTKADELWVAIADWLYMTYKKLGEDDAAIKLLEPLKEGMEVGENVHYYSRLLMYKGILTPDAILDIKTDYDPDITLATVGYGLGNYYLMNGNKEEAIKIFKKVMKCPQWPAFGYIASEVELTVLNLL